jgi:hypothetical protein
MGQCYEIGRSKETKRNELILGRMSMLIEVLVMGRATWSSCHVEDGSRSFLYITVTLGKSLKSNDETRVEESAT